MGTGKDATGGTYFVGFLILCVAVGFCVSALADFFMLTKIHGYYRATGASLSKAQAEFTTNVLSNEGVRLEIFVSFCLFVVSNCCWLRCLHLLVFRNAAAQAAAAGVRQGFQGGAQGQVLQY